MPIVKANSLGQTSKSFRISRDVYTMQVRTEARKVHDLFFDILKIAFPNTDFREASIIIQHHNSHTHRLSTIIHHHNSHTHRLSIIIHHNSHTQTEHYHYHLDIVTQSHTKHMVTLSSEQWPLCFEY